MKRINKGLEPGFLKKYRQGGGTPRPTYEDFHQTADLRELLVKRQNYVCCYCERRIRPETSTIEHFRPRNGPNARPDLQLTWSNLWAVCLGNRGAPEGQQHCDASKGDLNCELDPGVVIDSEFRFTATGEVHHHVAALDRQIALILRLNHPYLQEGRRKALEGMIEAIHRRSESEWAKALLERIYNSLPPEQPHLGYLRHWLQRRMGIV